MILLRYFSYIALQVIFCGFSVYAQDVTTLPVQSEEVKLQPKPKKKQSINFEDELVEGTAQKPELFYLFQKKNFNYKRLIRLRENFIPEMRRSSEDIKRLRGGR